jgi:transcriptional regulator with GAF, ATPase, and Fis domain
MLLPCHIIPASVSIMATTSSPLTQLAAACEAEGLTAENGEKIAAVLAAQLRVEPEDIGILRLESESLVFVHPAKLHDVVRIPLNNSSSAAVRTVNTKRPEIMNNFTKTRHTTLFEMVDVSGDPPAAGATSGASTGKNRLTMQKLMSVPVIVGDRVVGVIQVCRKGATLAAAGPDFVSSDLQRLVSLAGVLAKCFR